MKHVENLKIKIFADGADRAGMLDLYKRPYIRGFTTNPTLMRKAGLNDYETFAREILQLIPDRPINFEVFADEFIEMEQQAQHIRKWGANVYVKIPVTNTRGEPSYNLIRRLSADGVPLNITAVLTISQVESVLAALSPKASSIISLFAGRIADTGIDPIPSVRKAAKLLGSYPSVELLWASCRELLNIFQAEEAGCHIITVPHDILAKFSMIGTDLEQLSLDTVKMFHRDAAAAGLKL